MQRPKIKCVVWDLDHTVWEGTLLEGDQLVLRPGVSEAMATLDRRGILQSVASRNESGPARTQLRRFGLEHYVLHPQINWDAKSASIQRIVERLNLGADTFAFIDDQVFEREEVRSALPEVRTYDAGEVSRLLSDPDFMPAMITEDARRRREMYRADLARQEEEKTFRGPSGAYLATLGMVLSVDPAKAADLPRVAELVVRTNQLNTTGLLYSYEQLDALRRSPSHRLLIAELADKHGTYGKIGVILLHCGTAVWTIKLLLLSCRVMSRGVGGALIALLRCEALSAGVRLQADFRATERNRMMYITYKFAGFAEVSEAGGVIRLESAPLEGATLPSYLEVRSTWGGVVYG